MTVSSTENRKEYAGNGATVAFATSPVVFFDEADLDVYVVVDATGVATLKTITTHYTVSGGDGSTGTVTMVTAPATGETLVIVRNLAITQATDFVDNDGSDAEVAEDTIDRLTMIAQQLDARADRALALPDGDATGLDPVLPEATAAARGDKIIGFNTAGTALELKGAEDNTLLAAQLASTATGNGAALVGFLQSGTGAVAESVQAPLRRIVFAAQFGFLPAATGATNTAALKLFYTRINGSGDIGVINGGTYAMTDGVDPQTYELEDCTIICAGEVIINADALTSTNVVMQVGNNVSTFGSLTINITGTTAGSNGSVRLPLTIGRWWDGSHPVKNIYMQMLSLSNSYATANCMTIRGNTSGVIIDNLVVSGTYLHGLNAHWSDTANDASPTDTYHPNNIQVRNIYGEDALGALAYLSAVFNVKLGNVTGKDNVKGVDVYAGDYGASVANAAQSALVGHGIEIENLSVTNCGQRALLVNGKPGTSGSNLDMPVVVRGGRSTGDGGSSSDYGVEVIFSKRGEIGPVKMSNFGYGIRLGQGSEGYTLVSANPESNLVSGILCTGSGSDKSTDHFILNSSCRLNNVSAAGGVGNIYLAALSEDVTVFGGVVERSSADTTSNGVRIDSTTSLRHKIIGLRGKGFDTRSVVSISGPTAAAGIVVRDVTSDEANSSICDASTLVYTDSNASGRRRHPASINTAAVGNVGAGEDDLMTYALALGSLQTGDGVHITAWGVTANNSNPKTVKLYFGSAILTTALTISQAGVWRIEADVYSTGTDAQDYAAQLVQGGATTLVDAEQGSLTEDDGAAITIKCTGTVTDGGGGINNNDIVQNGLIVKFID